MNMFAIGVEINNKYIKYGLVSNLGNPKEINTIEMIKDNPSLTLSKLSSSILEMIKKYNVKVKGIGIAIPGILNNNKLIYSSNLKRWIGVNIVDFINRKTNLNTFICNDANVVALGESMFGVAKDANNVVLLTLDSGVGGGLIINKKLFEGNKGQGAELGHISINLNGKPCECGRRGCFEAYASSLALANQTIAEMNRNNRSVMWRLAKDDINNVDASIPWKAEKMGDNSAKKVIDQYITYLGEGILNYCNIFRPDIVVLAGEIAKQKANLITRVNKYVSEHNYGISGTAKVKVVTSKLGSDAYVIGAAALVFKK